MRRLLAATVLVALVALVARYPRQIRSRLTHWKAGPRHREPYQMPPPSAVRIAAVGDFGYRGRGVYKTGAAMAALGASDPYDVLLLLGDHSYPRGDPHALQRTVFEPFGRVLAQGTELLAVLGNHDVMKGHGDAQLAALGQSAHWWARELGPVLLVGLDSNPPIDPAQLAFLDATLEASNARWRIVALHYPPFSAGYQGSHLATREMFTPIFERHAVHLVLTGHDHDYQRSIPIDGVTYIVSGGGARPRLTSTRSFTAEAFRVRHFLDIAATPDTLTVQAVDEHGLVFDELVLCAPDAARAPSLPVGDQVPRFQATTRPGSR